MGNAKVGVRVRVDIRGSLHDQGSGLKVTVTVAVRGYYGYETGATIMNCFIIAIINTGAIMATKLQAPGLGKCAYRLEVMVGARVPKLCLEG